MSGGLGAGLEGLSLLSSAFGIFKSVQNTNSANDLTKSLGTQESSLLNEAHQQLLNEEAAPALIAERNSQENSLLSPTGDFTANNTLLAKPELSPEIKQFTGGK